MWTGPYRPGTKCGKISFFCGAGKRGLGPRIAGENRGCPKAGVSMSPVRAYQSLRDAENGPAWVHPVGLKGTE